MIEAEEVDATRPPADATWSCSHDNETMKLLIHPGDRHQHNPHLLFPSGDEAESEHDQIRSVVYSRAPSYPAEADQDETQTRDQEPLIAGRHTPST